MSGTSDMLGGLRGLSGSWSAQVRCFFVFPQSTSPVRVLAGNDLVYSSGRNLGSPICFPPVPPICLQSCLPVPPICLPVPPCAARNKRRGQKNAEVLKMSTLRLGKAESTSGLRFSESPRKIVGTPEVLVKIRALRVCFVAAQRFQSRT